MDGRAPNPPAPYGAYPALFNPVPVEPPAALPWHVRHPTWAAGLIAAGLLLGAFAVAHAEDAAPAKKAPDFVPFVVDQQQYAAALAYLNGLTFKDALPLVRWLNEQEDRAKGQWEADNRPKGEEKKP